ncbi:hypothetical protein LS482_15370 [Sinomicrobium kalidii]|uniref:hypothetical protein n=1 Tax=Sinomicrobium kalidii TaxID=2900738 RepID=UPI001E485AD0|nr:hypothetical protein [Sinomicrobium kalidii]UGU15054.1 hypothetical protein LS482_15370 [Sinomicrobium kalidii]
MAVFQALRRGRNGKFFGTAVYGRRNAFVTRLLAFRRYAEVENLSVPGGAAGEVPWMPDQIVTP